MYYKSKLVLMFKFLFDKKIPIREKMWIIIPLLYIISPIDLIPAPILGFSFIDDLVIFLYLMSMVNSKVDKYYNKKEEDIDKDKIVESVEYKVDEEEN